MDLYHAAEAGDLERVKVLVVEQGDDKGKTCGPYDRTPLYAASREGHLAVVRYFVEQGCNMEKADNNGFTPLITASGNGHLEVVRYLLEQGANRDKASDIGYTSLHWAAMRGHLEIAKLLMVYGADLNARTNNGLSPIDLADDEEIEQAIRDEPRRRMDHGHKRATEQDRHPNATTSASAQQEEEEEEAEDKKNKKPS